MLWGAFNNATQAMMATSHDMGSISQNIANVNTVGYKRKESLFKTLLSETTTSGGPGGTDIFTVRATDRYHVQNQGVVRPTAHWSDLAISGRGMFMVAPPAETGGAPLRATTEDPNAVLYTRSGQFHQVADATGRNYFVNSSGYHLLGWMANAQGVVTEGGSLEPVYTAPNMLMQGRTTTSATIQGNIDANAPLGPTAHTSDQNVATTMMGDQTLTETWTRTGPTSWTVTLGASGGGTVLTNASVAVEIDGFGNVLSTGLPTTTTVDWGGVVETVNINLGSTKPPPGHMEKFFIPVVDSALNEQTVAVGFERVGANQWYMHVNGQTTGTSVTFSDSGQILTGGTQALTTTFLNGADPDTTASFQLDLENLTQFNGPLYIGSIDQDGYKAGRLRSASFNSYGELVGTYDNAQTRTLFKVPVATFVSENNLTPISGTMFMRSRAAGDVVVSAVEDAAGGGGHIDPNAVESSTVDIEDEFTRMIMTQKAYSTNATVFRTADEMTTTARDLKT